MTCPHCGSPVENASGFCPTCGQSLQTGQPTQSYQQQPNYQQPNYQQPSYQYSGSYNQPVQPFPLKWYKFIIYFQLFLAMVNCIFNTITYFTGLHYGSITDAALVYNYYGMKLKVLDICFAILYLIAFVFAILVRQKLAHFKLKAPQWYLGFLIYTLALNILYLILASILIGVPLLDAALIGNLVGSVVMIVINWIYFNKRASLFIND